MSKIEFEGGECLPFDLETRSPYWLILLNDGPDIHNPFGRYYTESRCLELYAGKLDYGELVRLRLAVELIEKKVFEEDAN